MNELWLFLVENIDTGTNSTHSENTRLDDQLLQMCGYIMYALSHLSQFQVGVVTWTALSVFAVSGGDICDN